MKTAAAKMPVYSSDGTKSIGEIEYGQDVTELAQNDAGVLIAYIVGLVKKEDAANLIDAENWDELAGEREKFLAYAASRVGCLYVSGGQGQTMTKALIRKLEKDDSNYKRALASFGRHAEKGLSIAAYDCSGLVTAYLLKNKLTPRDLTANGIYYTICEHIKEGELTGGDLVFKKYRTNSRIYHVGIYMGDGTVVHARGRDYGVVREDIGKTGWNRFGRLKCFGEVRSRPTYSRMLKKVSHYMRGDDVRAAQEALLFRGHDPKGIDGIFGPKTEAAVISFQKAAGIKVDGIIGPVTWGEIDELVQSRAGTTTQWMKPAPKKMNK